MGQCNGVNHMVGDWGNMVGKGCVVDNRSNVMEDRVCDNLVAHLLNKKMLSKFTLVVNLF